MSQNRPPPAYQEYAASMLSNNNFRMMGLDARGLLYTLRLEYWVENPLPSDPVILAKILRLDPDSLCQALREIGDLIAIEGQMIKIPELDNYRKHLAEVREKQSSGGREGAAIARRNAKGRRMNEVPEPDPEGNLGVPNESTHGSSVQPRQAKTSTTKLNSVTNGEDEWLQDYQQSDVHGRKVSAAKT